MARIATNKNLRKATNDDWESVSGMGSGLETYLTTNSVLLEDGGNNMPVGFPTTVSANVLAFEQDYAAFKTASETGAASATKIKANNACNTTASEMLIDAAIVYRKKHEKAERYIFDRILDMINPKVAGMKGTILDGNTNAGVQGAEIKMQQENKVAITTLSDADGNYQHTGIEAATYTVTISKVAFETITEIIVIKVGTVSGRDFPLQHV